MTDLKEMECKSIKQVVIPMNVVEVENKLVQLDGWKHIDHKKLLKVFNFGDFNESIDFMNKVAGIARAQNHHPEMCIDFDKVKIEIYTHKIGGLHENDFILAAKVDAIES